MKTISVLILLLTSVISTLLGQTRFTSNTPGFIGVNTNSPTSFLTLQGNESASNSNDYRTFLKIDNRSNSNSSFSGLEITSGSPSYKTVLQHVASTYYFPGLDEYADFGQLYSRGAGLILRAGSSEFPNGVIKFMTGSSGSGGSIERMRIISNGNVGIGTQAPKAKLQVTDGDVYIQNPNRGIILTSPNGSCWRIIVDDFGNLVRLNITCPN